MRQNSLYECVNIRKIKFGAERIVVGIEFQVLSMRIRCWEMVVVVFVNQLHDFLAFEL